MIDGSTKAVVISPHPDDAVYSCPGWIRDRARAGENPAIVTLFTEASAEAPTQVRRGYQVRRNEDAAAAALVGATCTQAGFTDAPFRHDAYGSFSGIVCGPPEPDPALRSRVRDYLLRLARDLAPRIVLAPLAVGTHVDHLIAHQASLALLAEIPGVELAFYEDRPYAFVLESVRLRLAQLERTSTDPDFDAARVAERSERFFRGLFAAPYVRQHIGATDQAVVVAHHLSIFASESIRTLRSTRSSLMSWPPTVMRDLLPAIEAYGSQTPGFLGSPLYHQWASMEYSRRLGHPNRYVERLWHF